MKTLAIIMCILLCGCIENSYTHTRYDTDGHITAQIELRGAKANINTNIGGMVIRLPDGACVVVFNSTVEDSPESMEAILKLLRVAFPSFLWEAEE